MRTKAKRAAARKVDVADLREAVPRPEGRWLEEAVRARAYELFLDRAVDGRDGDAVGDWVRAEREVRGRFGVRGCP